MDEWTEIKDALRPLAGASLKLKEAQRRLERVRDYGANEETRLQAAQMLRSVRLMQVEIRSLQRTRKWSSVAKGKLTSTEEPLEAADGATA